MDVLITYSAGMANAVSKFVAGTEAALAAAILSWLEDQVGGEPEVTVAELLGRARHQRDEAFAVADAAGASAHRL